MLHSVEVTRLDAMNHGVELPSRAQRSVRCGREVDAVGHGVEPSTRRQKGLRAQACDRATGRLGSRVVEKAWLAMWKYHGVIARSLLVGSAVCAPPAPSALMRAAPSRNEPVCM